MMTQRERDALAEAIECVAENQVATTERIAAWQDVLGESGGDAQSDDRLRPVHMPSETLAIPSWSSERSAGQLSFWLRRELLDYAVRALSNNQLDVACQLIGAYETLMRAGL